jgi:hypothetical protein
MRWAVLEHSGHSGVGSAEAAVDDVAVGDSFRRVHVVERPGDHGLIDDYTERGPRDDDVRLHLEAIDRLDPADKAMVKTFLDAFLLRADAKRWTRAG